MTEAIIQKIAHEIVHEQILLNWFFYLILFLLALISAAIANFLVAYFRSRGQTFATKADFAEIVEQLKATTSATEEVKAIVNHNDWAVREWKTIRRLKLEELITAIYESRHWLELELNSRIFRSESYDEKNPIEKVAIIAKLYFPELEVEISELKLQMAELRAFIVDTHAKSLAAGENMVARKLVMDDFLVAYKGYYMNTTLKISVVENKLPQLMNTIVGV